IGALADIRLSANWMAAAGYAGEDARLYETVKAVGMELCPELGITIPVGKDSLSMRTVWQEGEQRHVMAAPLSLVVSAFAPVQDVRLGLTPRLRVDNAANTLMLLDLGRGSRRLGGSALAQVYSQLGDEVPDLHSANDLKQFFGFIQAALEQRLLLAYHDRSGGGLKVTLLEMAVAGHCGWQLNLDNACQASLLEGLFAEELGAVVQVLDEQLPALQARAEEYGMADICLPLGR